MGLENGRRGLSDRLVEDTVKFGGGSVMLWDCMLWDGPGVRIDSLEIMTYGLNPRDLYKRVTWLAK